MFVSDQPGCFNIADIESQCARDDACCNKAASVVTSERGHGVDPNRSASFSWPAVPRLYLAGREDVLNLLAQHLPRCAEGDGAVSRVTIDGCRIRDVPMQHSPGARE